MSFKETVYKKCILLLEEKIINLQKTLTDLLESAANETKSTAGDKHETALAMLQIEQENTARQLKEALDRKLKLLAVDITNTTDQITTGSLIYSNKGLLFISIGLGKISIGDSIIFALSPQSPLGQKLLGLKTNESAEMNGVVYKIENLE